MMIITSSDEILWYHQGDNLSNVGEIERPKDELFGGG